MGYDANNGNRQSFLSHSAEEQKKSLTRRIGKVFRP